MFGFTYKLTTVNADKNIVRLTPTLATWLKAFGPSLVMGLGVGAMYVYGTVLERREENTITEYEDPGS